MVGIALAGIADASTVTLTIQGQGRIYLSWTSASVFYNNYYCDQTCAFTADTGTTIAFFNPTPVLGWAFSSWSGACGGTSGCTIIAAGTSQTATATFTQLTSATLSLTETGSGTGVVTSSPVGINCPAGACSAVFAINAVVTLTATANSTSTFSGWSGACSGTGTCSVTMSAAQSVSASFTLKSTPLLSVTLTGTGSGTVSSLPSGINCVGVACNAAFNAGTSVSLNVTPSSGSVFAGWSGACSGTGTCTVTMSTAQAVNAAFTSTGGTTVDGNCTIAVQSGYWWNKNEAGRGFIIEQQAATLYVAAFLYDTSGRATWNLATGPLNIASAGAGGVCTMTAPILAYANGQTFTGSYKAPSAPTTLGTMTLTFTDTTHATLYWPGGISGIQRFPIPGGGLAFGPSATQPQTGYWWNPAQAGRGFGIEIQNSLMYFAGFMYDSVGNPLWYLTSGSLSSQAVYSGSWLQYANGQTLTGAYKVPTLATSPGTVTMQFSSPTAGMLTLPNGSQLALSRFTFVTGTTAPKLTVALSGNGQGTVTSSPAGIACGTACSVTYAVGTAVTLSANPFAGTTFGGWNGACTGTGVCNLTLNANANVGATFSQSGTSSTLVVNVDGPGTVTSLSGEINCSQTSVSGCSASFATGASVTLVATPNAGSYFQSWSGGDCFGMGSIATCTIPVSGARSVSAKFLPQSDNGGGGV